MEKPMDVDAFIANANDEAQPILKALRKKMKTFFPGIEEKIGYGVPQYKFDNRTIGMSVAKKHVTLGFDYGILTDEIRSRLEGKGYKLGLQTMQIKFHQEIPEDEIEELFAKVKKE